MLAAKAQAHASKCRWGHTDGAGLQGNGESIMSSPPQVVFPLQGMDACTYAAWALYQEVTVRPVSPWRSQDCPLHATGTAH